MNQLCPSAGTDLHLQQQICPASCNYITKQGAPLSIVWIIFFKFSCRMFFLPNFVGSATREVCRKERLFPAQRSFSKYRSTGRTRRGGDAERSVRSPACACTRYRFR